jgi:hypothetical protein
MDPRRHETETAASTTPTTIVETPTKAKRERGTTTAGVKAGQLFEKLQLLDEEELAELAASPADIRAKYDAKKAKLLGEVSDDVRKLVEKLRAP